SRNRVSNAVSSTGSPMRHSSRSYCGYVGLSASRREPPPPTEARCAAVGVGVRGNRALRLRNCLNLQADLHVVADEEPAGFERGIPLQAEVISGASIPIAAASRKPQQEQEHVREIQIERERAADGGCARVTIHRLESHGLQTLRVVRRQP